jgi:hypothetical protein
MTGMISSRPAAVFAAAVTLSFAFAGSAAAEAAEASSGVSLKVITFGDERARLQSTPIEERPYRPLHFYGNRVRRQSRRSTTGSATGSTAHTSAGSTQATPASNSSRTQNRG